MGYRSTGAFRATGRPDDLFAVIATLRLTYHDQEALKAALKDCVLSEGMFGFDIDDWKWYDSYAEVKAFQAIMSAFVMDNKRFTTGFVRIGEDDDDTETCFTGDDGYDLVEYARTYSAKKYPNDTNLLSSTIEETRSEDVNQELVT